MPNYVRKSPPLDPCPVEHAVEVIGGRWKARILHWLVLGEASVADIRRHIPRASAQVLASQLSAMERDGLVVRLAPAGRRLWGAWRATRKGEGLHAALDALARWGSEELGGWEAPVRRDAPDAGMA